MVELLFAGKCSANVENGSAHFSNKFSQAWLRCLIHIRVDNTPGNKCERLEERNSPITVGISNFRSAIEDCTAER